MIITGNALVELKKLPDKSQNCCVTSPPYYRLRDYGMDDQIGLEYSLLEYINKLVAVFDEVKRVLKDDGTLWLNMGDSYAGSGKGEANYPQDNYFQKTNPGSLSVKGTAGFIPFGFKQKDLMGVPWRLAIALQDAGWYLRQDIIWQKPNAMPESVKDRCTKSHEYIFLLSKSKKYYFDYEAIKEPCVNGDPNPPRGSKGVITNQNKGNRKSFRGGGTYTNNKSFNNSASAENETVGNKPNSLLLRNKRSVWSVSISQLKEAHFATFPEKLIEPCILAGCPKDGSVIDPFFGSGTVGVVAKKHKRDFLGIDINPLYTQMAEKRINKK